MGIIEFMVIAVVIGLVIWAIHAFTPIPVQIKKVILWAGILVIVLLLLNALGIVGKDWNIPRIR